MHDISFSMTQPSSVHSLLLKQFTYNTLYIFWWRTCINKFSELRFSDCLYKPISSINRDAICKPISSFYQKMEILVKYWQTLNKTEKTSRIAQYTCKWSQSTSCHLPRCHNERKYLFYISLYQILPFYTYSVEFVCVSLNSCSSM